MKSKFLQRSLSAFLAAAMVATSVVPAMASGSSNVDNTATQNDLDNADIINYDAKGSLTIHKYDITKATQDGVYEEGAFTATGQNDEDLEEKIADYAIKGVEFTYLRVGNIEQYSITDGSGTQVNLVYEIPGELAAILGLADEDGNLLKLTYDSMGDVTGFEAGDNAGDDSLNATDMMAPGIDADNQCDGDTDNDKVKDVYHYTSDQIQGALDDLLSADYVNAKNLLEMYMDYEGDSVAMPYTDASGVTTATDLELGLYLVVETAVPENVVDTVNPFFVSIPMTNVADDDTDGNSADNEDGGQYWFYDVDVYPKNQTGNPTLDKMVRNATGTLEDEYGNSQDEDYSRIQSDTINYSDNFAATGSVTDLDGDDDIDADDFLLRASYGELGSSLTAEAFAAQRGDGTYSTTNQTNTIAGATDTDSDDDGLTDGNSNDGKSEDGTIKSSETTAGEYQYSSTTTASSGDVLDYILVSKIPHISSTATYLTEYTFKDVLSEGITYNNDVRIAFYTSAADAYTNNTEAAVDIWDASDITYSIFGVEETGNTSALAKESYDYVKAGTNYGETQLTISLTEAGLAAINGDNTLDENGEVDPTKGYSDYYMVVYYTATVNSDDSLVLGDAGNENDVTLEWSRTSTGYYDTLEDESIVYSYGIDLQKEFSDGATTFEDVTFNIYNKSDGYYVIAEETSTGSGTYWVTGKTADQADATVFTPNADTGKLQVYGLEGDSYAITELSTSNGYSLLADQIVVDIATASRSIQAAVAGWTGQGYSVKGITYADDGSGDIASIMFEYDSDGDGTAEIYYWAADTNTFWTGGVGVANGGTQVTDENVVATLGNNLTGKVDMIVGNLVEGAATVDGVLATMLSDTYTEYQDNTSEDNANKTGTETESANAIVALTITNTKNFTLPLTGGAGLYLITILGVVAVAGGCWFAFGKKKEGKEQMAA